MAIRKEITLEKDKLYTMDEIAEALEVRILTIARWRKNGLKIEPIQWRVFIKGQSIIDYFNNPAYATRVLYNIKLV